MNQAHDDLDQALSALPQDIPPARDLWPAISAELRSKPGSNTWYRAAASLKWQLAAGIALMALSSSVTYFAVRPAPAVQTAATGDVAHAGDVLALEYLRARADLDRVFAQRIALLPPATRAKVQGDLDELRRAATQLTATLAEHPSDALLQELLLSTRQRELQLLAYVSQVSSPTS